MKAIGKPMKNSWMVLVLLISFLLVSLTNLGGEAEKAFKKLSSSLSSSFDHDDAFNSSHLPPNHGLLLEAQSLLQYDFYRDLCPQAEKIVRSTMSQIFSQHKDTSAALLRLFFHDCFIQGCDASVLLENSNDNKNHSTERQAIPNKTLKGFDKIDMIKEEIEKACPGVVSCADILVLATREGIVLAGGPFFPVFTGRRDSTRSYYEEATAEIPKPDDNITQTLNLFARKGFTKTETVSLLGAHNIGKISCEFMEKRLYDFMGTGQPDPSIASDFLEEMRQNCRSDSNSNNSQSSRRQASEKSVTKMTMSYSHDLSSSIKSGSNFDTHYYNSLLRGRGLLFADQQLMYDKTTATLVGAYASDDGSTFRRDFARAMVKMSRIGVLTGSRGQIRLNCSTTN